MDKGDVILSTKAFLKDSKIVEEKTKEIIASFSGWDYNSITAVLNCVESGIGHNLMIPS